MKSTILPFAVVAAVLITAPPFASGEEPPYAGGHDDATYPSDLPRGPIAAPAAAPAAETPRVTAERRPATRTADERDASAERAARHERMVSRCTCHGET